MKKDGVQNLLKLLGNKPQRKRNDHILLVDGMNMFIRGFTSVKTLNRKGQHTGGMIGFLRSLGFVTRMHNPTRVICIFDGKGSSINRRNIDSNYKSQRGINKITNWGAYSSVQEEKDSMESQVSRLYDYLETLPVDVLSLEKVEADDIISFLAQSAAGIGRKATIVSSDKDFLQIIRKGIQVYRPVEKKLYNHTNVKNTIKVLPENFLTVKALLGDNSDNLTGVKGLGEKTLLKLFPELSTDPNFKLQEVYDRCEKRLDDKLIYSKIVNDWDKVEQNYNIMNLHVPRLTDEEKTYIFKQLSQFNPGLNINTFLYYLEQDSIEGITRNTEGWLIEFKYLSLFK